MRAEARGLGVPAAVRAEARGLGVRVGLGRFSERALAELPDEIDMGVGVGLVVGEA